MKWTITRKKGKKKVKRPIRKQLYHCSVLFLLHRVTTQKLLKLKMLEIKQNVKEKRNWQVKEEMVGS